MNLKTKVKNRSLLHILRRKASQSPSKFKISAIAFSAKGDILGTVTNSYTGMPKAKVRCWHGAGKHAERELIRRYGYKIRSILVCRTSNTGKFLPIEACPICQKVAAKFGIQIFCVQPQGE